jgi:hypothetical protein
MTTIHTSGLAVLLLACLISFNLLACLEKLDAKLASKDDIIASIMNDKLPSKNAMVDSLTQEMEKLVLEVALKNDIIASLDAKLASTNDELLSKNIMVDSMTQEMMEMHDSRMFLASKDVIIKSDSQDYHLSTTIPTWLVLSCKDVIRRFGDIDSFLTMMVRNNSEEEIRKTSKVFVKDGLFSSQWLSCIIPMRKFMIYTKLDCPSGGVFVMMKCW